MTINKKQITSYQDYVMMGIDFCKEEILKILQKHTTERHGPHGTGTEYISADAIDEIRKL